MVASNTEHGLSRPSNSPPRKASKTRVKGATFKQTSDCASFQSKQSITILLPGPIRSET
jgi:hypothetical protein